MGVSKIGDRLYLVDCLQQLYEELTAWKQAREKMAAKPQARASAVPALPGGSASSGGYGATQQAATNAYAQQQYVKQQQQQQQRAAQATAGGASGGISQAVLQ